MDDAKKTPLVVVGVDGSDDALRAVTFGVRSAFRRKGDLLIVNAVDDAVLAGSWGVVYDPVMLQRGGQTATEDAKKFAVETGFPAERVQTDVLLGNSAAVLVRLSEEADLVVVGRRSATGLERMFVGSTSVSVAASASCPVVVVSAASNPNPTGNFGVVGICIESSAACLGTAEQGLKEAQLRGAKARFVNIVQPPMGIFGPKLKPAELDQQVVYVRGGIEAMIEPLKEKYPDVEVDFEVVAGAPINDLVARSEQVDLLVLGVHGNGLPGFALGGLTRGLMAHTKCPLMLVR
ncbi:MAG: universal stress protein UspA [Propionibacterium sp.]|nr:MAG: universal stress protein UspA [Propionibacterium sp.]